MKKIKLIPIFFLLGFSLPTFAKVNFGPSDLNKNDEVLFTLSQEMSGINTYSSLFYAKLENGQSSTNPQLLTCYPEKMELLNGNSILQIRNRYGIGIYDIINSTFEWKSQYDGIPVNSLPVSVFSVSSKGNYYCSMEKEKNSLSFGTIYLTEIGTGKKKVLCENVRQNYNSLNVKWNKEGTVLLYEKDGDVYFCNPQAVIRGVEMDEIYRKIGRGSINSVNWAGDKSIIYIDDYLIYQINSKELYTIGLYSGIIGQGKVIGRLPSQFNPQTDKFSVNVNIDSLVVIQNNRLFSYLKFMPSTCDYMDVVYSGPYIDSTASLLNSFVVWDKDSTPYLWLEKYPFNGSKEKCSVYKLTTKATPVLEIADSGTPILSPDGTKIAFFAGASIYVYDTSTWKRIAELSGEKIVNAIWASNTALYVGGEKTVRKWNLLTNQSEVILLSSVKAGYWNDKNEIIADTGLKDFYIYNRSKKTWSKTVPFEKACVLENGRYRIFNGSTPNKKFENALYIRSLSKKAVTKPMYAQSVIKTPEQKKVAIIIDAYDNADGLTNILAVLQKYNIKATFFMNGEFIRRYPSETKQIVFNGYDTASMFFSQTDLVNNPFVIDEDFIRRGLARNEDEFYQCTGKELSLYWHAPYYSIDPKIIAFGNTAGYTYVNSFNLINDSPKLNKDIKPEVIIQNYCESLKKTGGGIVPVSAGFSQGNRTDPLYNYLDILICALVDNGFDFVGIQDL